MKSMGLLLLLVLAGCAAYRPVPPGEMVIRTKLEVPAMAQEEIFRKSRAWIARHLNSRGEIIASADSKAGVIIANGYIDYPAADRLEAIDKIQYTITFSMKEEISASGVSLTFSGLLLDVPKVYQVHGRFWPLQEYTGGYSVPIEFREDLDAARRGMLAISDRLEKCLARSQCE